MRKFLGVVIFSVIISVFAEGDICPTTTFSVDNSNHKYIPVNDHGWHVITVNSSVPMENISSLKPPKVTSKAYQVDVEDMNCEKPNISKKTCRFKVRVSYPAGPPSQTNDFFKGGEVTFKTNHGICNYELAMHPYSSQLFSNFRTIFPGEQPYYPDGNGVAELGTTLLANQSQYVVFMLQNTSAFMNKNNVIIKEIKLSDNNNAGRVNWNLMERSDKDVDQIYGKLEQCGTEGDSKKGKPISYSLSSLDKSNSCFLIYQVKSSADAATKVADLTVTTNLGTKNLRISTRYTAKTQHSQDTLFFSTEDGTYSCGFEDFIHLGHTCMVVDPTTHAFANEIKQLVRSNLNKKFMYFMQPPDSPKEAELKAEQFIFSGKFMDLGIVMNIAFGSSENIFPHSENSGWSPGKVPNGTDSKTWQRRVYEADLENTSIAPQIITGKSIYIEGIDQGVSLISYSRKNPLENVDFAAEKNYPVIYLNNGFLRFGSLVLPQKIAASDNKAIQIVHGQKYSGSMIMYMYSDKSLHAYPYGLEQIKSASYIDLFEIVKKPYTLHFWSYVSHEVSSN